MRWFRISIQKAHCFERPGRDRRGSTMNDHNSEPRAIFLSPDGSLYPDTLICSGVIPPSSAASPVRFPRLDACRTLPHSIWLQPTTRLIRDSPVTYARPVPSSNLPSLQHWQGHGRQQFPEEFLPLRSFKCRQWFWLVVPGLHHAEPKAIAYNRKLTAEAAP